MAWAGFELATVLYVFNFISVDERSSVMSYMAVLQSTMMSVGSVIGGYVLVYFENSYTGYMVIFILSCFMRSLTVIPLFRASEIRPRMSAIAFRTLGLRPGQGGIDRPITSDED